MHPTPTGCLACDLLSGARPLPGGRLYATPLWVVEHTVGPLPPGTLVVKPTRHVVRVGDLTDGEAAELGGLLRRTAAAVNEVIRPEQVYTCLWSHAGGVPGHIHFVVQPVTAADLERYGLLGPDLQAAMFRAGETPEAADVEAICARLRPALDR